jgi:hypothetical protein
MIRAAGMEDNPDRAGEYPDPASRLENRHLLEATLAGESRC